MKRINRAAILSAIRDATAIPRAEIAVRTGLTKATVTNLVGELVDEGVLLEQGRAQSTGGRRPIPVALNPDSRFAVGVDVGIHEVRVVAVDLNAAVLVQRRYALSFLQGNEQFLGVLGQAIADLLAIVFAMPGRSREQWLGIGIGMHGIVDARTGISVFAPNLRLSGIHIREQLEARFGVDVLVDNDVRATAAAEQWFANPGELSNFVYVNVGVGVGAAIVLHGEILNGVSGSAGEIGHTVVEASGRVCACGKRGCLETVCSGPSLAHRAREAVRNGQTSLVEQLVQGDMGAVTGYTVFQAADLGDGVAQKLFRSAGTALGEMIGHLVNALDPQAVVIGGGVSNAGHHLFDPLRERVEHIALGRARDQIKITPGLVKDATQVGAATMVLKRFFGQEL